MLSQYPIFGGQVLCLLNPVRFQGKTCKLTRHQVIPPKKTAFLWWHYSVTSYNNKCWILSWRVLERKEQLKDDANFSWIILLTWEFSGLFGCSLTLFSLKSINSLTSWMHYYWEKTPHFLLIRETTCTFLVSLRTQIQKGVFQNTRLTFCWEKKCPPAAQKEQFSHLPLKIRRAYSGDWALKLYREIKVVLSYGITE